MERRRLPNLLVCGVPKAGTTSLHTYLSLHPDVCGSLTKELGFFEPSFYGKEVPSNSEYSSHFRHCRGEAYLLESTPNYLYGGKRLIKEIGNRLGSDVRIIMILRNPVDRFISQYRHQVTKMEIPAHTTLAEFIQNPRSMTTVVNDNDTEYRIPGFLEQGKYAHYLPHWFEAFGDRMLVLFFDDLESSPSNFMMNVCHWLGIDFNQYGSRDFAIENRSAYYRLWSVHKLAMWFNNRTETFWRKNVRPKRIIRQTYYAVNERKGAPGQDPQTIQKLEHIYANPNKDLHELLNKYGIGKLPFWLDSV